MAVMRNNSARHPIGYVAATTGLSTHVIRVWERRHGAIRPCRTDTNRRKYSDSDIDRLRMLGALTQSGHGIGSIAECSDDELREMLRNLSVSGPYSERPGSARADGAIGASSALLPCQQAVIEMDASLLDELLARATVTLPQISLLEDLVAPLMVWVGECWHEGTLRIAQEHLASATVASFLTRLRQSIAVADGAPLLAVATPAGETHELGALMASIAATAEGWNTLYFGASLPAAELANAAERVKAQAVALSVVRPGQRNAWVQEIRDLRQYLSAELPLIIGGDGVSGNRIALEIPGVYCVEDLRSFQTTLRSVAQ